MDPLLIATWRYSKRKFISNPGVSVRPCPHSGRHQRLLSFAEWSFCALSRSALAIQSFHLIDALPRQTDNIAITMSSYLPTPPSEPSDQATSSFSIPLPARAPLPAKQATIYIPTPIHPITERYAEERFRTVVRPIGGVTEEECLAQADGIGACCRRR